MTLTYADLDYFTTEAEFLADRYETTDEDVDAMLADANLFDRMVAVDAINAAHEATCN